MSEIKPSKDDPAPEPQIVCPWWICFTFDNFLRRMLQNPERILKPYIKPGWTILDVGPGMGYFTIAMAKLAGDSGKVIAADLQLQMLEAIRHRANKAGVEKRIVLHRATPESIGINEAVDFCLAFWMVHEVPDRPRFINEIVSNLKPGGLFLFAEPNIHVTKKSFEASLEMAKNAGLAVVDQPKIFLSYTALLKK